MSICEAGVLTSVHLDGLASFRVLTAAAPGNVERRDADPVDAPHREIAEALRRAAFIPSSEASKGVFSGRLLRPRSPVSEGGVPTLGGCVDADWWELDWLGRQTVRELPVFDVLAPPNGGMIELLAFEMLAPPSGGMTEIPVFETLSPLSDGGLTELQVFELLPTNALLTGLVVFDVLLLEESGYLCTFACPIWGAHVPFGHISGRDVTHEEVVSCASPSWFEEQLSTVERDQSAMTSMGTVAWPSDLYSNGSASMRVIPSDGTVAWNGTLVSEILRGRGGWVNLETYAVSVECENFAVVGCSRASENGLPATGSCRGIVDVGIEVTVDARGLWI